MDAYGDHFTYSSHEQDRESYPYTSNFEESQNRVFGQYYDDGGYYEDGMYSYDQQTMCNEGYNQGNERPNYYREEHCYPYTSNFDDSQCSYVEDSYDQYHSNSQINGGSSNLRGTIENLAEKANELQAQQAKMFKDLEVIQAQMTRMMETNQEVHEPHKEDDGEQMGELQAMKATLAQHSEMMENILESLNHRSLENSFETPDQAFKEIEDDEDSTIVDYILGMFSTPPIEDELEPCLEETLEEEHLKPREFDLHKDFVEEGNDLSSEQPSIQEKTSLKEDFEIWEPMVIIEKLKEGVPIELEDSFEDPFFFILPLDKFRSFRPYISISIKRSSYNPMTLKGLSFFTGLNVHLEVHCRLDGREFKWDLKVD